MNNKGEFKITGMMLSLLFAFGLFIAFVGWAVTAAGGIDGYNIDGYDEAELEEFNQFDDLNRTINANKDGIDNSNVDKDAFDFFSAIWDKLSSPFRNIYNSFNNMVNVFTGVSRLLGLPIIFTQFFTAAIVVMVLIGIVMIKFKLGRQK